MEPPNENIKIKIFHDQKEVMLPPHIKEELEEIYRRKLEEQKVQKQNNIFKAEILSHKIRRILPKNSSVPRSMLRLIQDDEPFNQLTKFLDTCYRIQRVTSDWTPEEIDFNHGLFRQLSIIHRELSETLHEYSDSHCPESDLLIKNLMQQAYMPSHIILAVHKAKKIVKNDPFKFSKELENWLIDILKDPDKFEHFITYVDTCAEAQKLKSEGKTEEWQQILRKIKFNLFPLFHVYFRSENKVIRLAEAMKRAVEADNPRGYLSFIWGS